MSGPNNFTCGFCGTLVPWLPEAELGTTTEHFSMYTGNEDAKWWSMKCASCGRFTTMMVASQTQTVRYYPPEGVARIDTDGIPDHISADYFEAIRCLHASAFKAATAMARRTVQAVCIRLGADPKAKLFVQIDALNAEGEFTNRLTRLAHKTRALGNSGAHPGADGLDEVTPGEAADAVRFVEHLLQHVFILGGEDEDE